MTKDYYSIVEFYNPLDTLETKYIYALVTIIFCKVNQTQQRSSSCSIALCR